MILIDPYAPLGLSKMKAILLMIWVVSISIAVVILSIVILQRISRLVTNLNTEGFIDLSVTNFQKETILSRIKAALFVNDVPNISDSNLSKDMQDDAFSIVGDYNPKDISFLSQVRDDMIKIGITKLLNLENKHFMLFFEKENLQGKMYVIMNSSSDQDLDDFLQQFGFFLNKRFSCSIPKGIQVKLECEKNNRYKNLNKFIIKSGIHHNIQLTLPCVTKMTIS